MAQSAITLSGIVSGGGDGGTLEGIWSIKDSTFAGGCKGDGVTDDSDALQAAYDAALAETTAGVPTIPILWAPAGRYRIHEVNGYRQVLLEGVGPYNTQFRYNGAGGSGSYVIKSDPADAYGGGGFKAVSIKGHDLSTDSQPVAEVCLDLTNDSNGPDWGYRLEMVHIGWCFGDGLVLGAAEITNLHMDRMRFDTIGGWAVRMALAAGTGRPITISKFTYASVIDPDKTAFIASVTDDGYYDGTNWGYGFLYIDGATGNRIELNDARLELSPLNVFDNRRQIIYVASGAPTVACSRIVGGFRQSTPGIFFRDAGGHAQFFLDGDSNITYAKVYETSRAGSPEWDIGSQGHEKIPQAAFFGGPGGANGIYMNGSQQEFRDAAPDSTVDRDYKRGDVIWNRRPAFRNPLGWIVTAPEDGWGNPAAPTLTTTAHVTASSATVAITTANDFYKFPVGAAIRLIGAGAAGANLDTTIVDIDYEAQTFDVADTPSTTVNPATIKMQTATFAAWGTIPGAFSDTADADAGIKGNIATTALGANDTMDVGERFGGTDYGRSLVRFDLSSIPVDAVVGSATLRLYDRGDDTSNNARTMRCYRVLQPWVEATVTWNKYDGSNNWVSAGCSDTTSDRETAELGSISVPGTEVEGLIEIDLDAALVQEWIHGDLDNNGLILVMDTASDDMHRYATKENTALPGPSIQINYT